MSEEVLEALSKQDVEGLRSLSRKGFPTETLRARAWELLLAHPAPVGTEDFSTTSTAPAGSKHPYSGIIEKDVARSLGNYDMDEDRKLKVRKQLTETLELLLDNLYPKGFHYIQGLHEVVVVAMLALPEDDFVRMKLIQRICTVRIRDSLRTSLDVLMGQLSLVFPLVGLENPQLEAFLVRSDVGSIFILPWVLTWFSHVLNKLEDSIRAFDYFCAMPASMPIYLSAAVILSQSQSILKLECEYSEIHRHFQEFPDHLFSAQEFPKLCKSAERLYLRMKPRVLRKRFFDKRISLPEDSPFDQEFPVQGNSRTMTIVTYAAVPIIAIAVVFIARQWNLHTVWPLSIIKWY